MTEHLTILRARHRRLAKTIEADGTIRGYDLARTLDAAEIAVRDLDHLADLLRQLAPRSDCCVVRGALIDPSHAKGIRRLLYADPETGEAPTFREQARRWLALDMDGVPLPVGIDPANLHACADAVVPLLPPAFHGAAVIVQATASHGLKPGARLRLWFWLDKPLIGAEVKRWLRGAPVDAIIFVPVQAIYTASPVFEGRPDHLPHRLAVIGGIPVVPTPDAADLTEPARKVGQLVPLHPSNDRYATAVLRNAYVSIATAPEGARHPTAKTEAWSLARLVRRGVITEGEMQETICRGLMDAGKDAAEAAAISAWALAHRGGENPHG